VEALDEDELARTVAARSLAHAFGVESPPATSAI
jgi:hypothetical protein